MHGLARSGRSCDAFWHHATTLDVHLYAGTPRVLSTLGSVADVSTTRVMTLFYQAF